VQIMCVGFDSDRRKRKVDDAVRLLACVTNDEGEGEIGRQKNNDDFCRFANAAA